MNGFNEEIQSRFKSKVVWGSVIMLILNNLAHFKLYEMIGLDSVGYQILVTMVFDIFILFGFINNPTVKNKL